MQQGFQGLSQCAGLRVSKQSQRPRSEARPLSAQHSLSARHLPLHVYPLWKWVFGQFLLPLVVLGGLLVLLDVWTGWDPTRGPSEEQTLRLPWDSGLAAPYLVSGQPRRMRALTEGCHAPRGGTREWPGQADLPLLTVAPGGPWELRLAKMGVIWGALWLQRARFCSLRYSLNRTSSRAPGDGVLCLEQCLDWPHLFLRKWSMERVLYAVKMSNSSYYSHTSELPIGIFVLDVCLPLSRGISYPQWKTCHTFLCFYFTLSGGKRTRNTEEYAELS